MLMYGMDGHGNPQFIDEDVVSLLLQNPHAKKVRNIDMLIYEIHIYHLFFQF